MMRCRQWHILPKTLARVTRPNKAALKLLILVGQQCAEVLIAGNLALCASWKLIEEWYFSVVQSNV